MNTSTVREQLLEHAQTLLMARGYNGFSYRDLATLVGVKTSSIHYHFPSKDQLALAAVDAYREAARERTTRIPATLSPDARLRMFVDDVARSPRRAEHICLCGMLAADMASLPESVRSAVRGYFEENEAWLAEVLTEGRAQGVLVVKDSPRVSARTLMAAFQGGVLAARLFDEPSRIVEVIDAWIA